MPRCRGKTLYPPHATHLASSSGGTQSFPNRTNKWPCDARIRGTFGIAIRTISQIRRIWLLLGWIQRMNRAFLSFTLCLRPFFFFSLCFCSLWVCCDRLAPTLFHAFLIVTHHERVAAHEAIPSCSSARLLSYPLTWLHSSSLWFYPFHILHQLFLPLWPLPFSSQRVFSSFVFSPLRSLPIQILLQFPFPRNSPTS